jgi:hypothetical protein
VDDRPIMPVSRNAERETIAQFSSGCILKQSHWYLIITPMKEGFVDSRIVNAFPPLRKLASLSEEMMQALLYMAN